MVNAPDPGPERLTSPAPAGVIEIGAGATVTLPKGPTILQAEGGAAEIYLETSAGRCLIAVITVGGYVFALPAGAEAEFVAVGDAGARLVPTEMRGADPETADGACLIGAADAWIRTIAKTLVMPTPEIAPLPAASGEPVPEQTWLTSTGSVVWLTASHVRHIGADASATVLPLTGRLVAMAEGAEALLSSADLMREGRLITALEAFNTGLAAHVEALRTAADTARLAAVTGDGPVPGAARRSGASAAIESVAAAIGIEINEPVGGGAVGFAAVPGLMRRAGLRGRRITLAQSWSARDIGPIIAEDQATGDPCALIWRKGAYRFADGISITRGREAGFGPFAYAVHSPLPDRVKGLFSLALYLLPAIRRDSGMAFAAGAGASLIGVIVPLATGWILSDIVPASLATLLFAVGGGLVAGAVVTTIFSAARSLALQRITGRTGIDLAAAVADKILRLPPSFFRGYSAGDLNQRIQAIDQLRQLVTGVMLSAGMTLIFSLFYFVTLLAFDAKLAGLAVLLVLIYVLATLLARTLQMGHVRKAAEFDGKVSGASFETLAAVSKLRVAAAEERAYLRWMKLYAEEQRAAVAMGRIGAHFSSFSDAYQIITMMTLFAVAAFMQNQDLPAGHFIGFLVAFGSFQGAFTGFCDGLMSLFTAAPMAERAKPVFETEAETSIGRADPGRLTGAIELSGLSFTYPGARQLLDGVDLTIAPGEHVAIVGGSGSGKSTILRLLLGFETPERGAITYDGRELSRLDLGRVRAQIGVVMQSSRLFAGSIFENVRGAADAGLEACTTAAERAGLGPDLATFPMGLHTPITEGAGALSGGQKQRILIARALVGAPAIQFFDEATSALDNATQAVVMRTLDASSATRVTIAHRLSTVRHADRICVLKDGRFAEVGTYDELMALNGHFVALAQRQLLET